MESSPDCCSLMIGVSPHVSFKTRIWTGWTDFAAWRGPVLRRTALQADAYWTDVRTKGVALGY